MFFASAGAGGIEAVKPRLEELITEWEPRTTAKQRITAMRLHRQLVSEGYRGGGTLVADYWREPCGPSDPGNRDRP